MQVYWVILPGKVVKQQVEQLMRSFLWGGTDLKNTGAAFAGILFANQEIKEG